MNKWSEFHEGEDGKYRKFGIKGIIQPVCEKLIVIAKIITARVNDIITQMHLYLALVCIVSRIYSVRFRLRSFTTYLDLAWTVSTSRSHHFSIIPLPWWTLNILQYSLIRPLSISSIVLRLPHTFQPYNFCLNLGMILEFMNNIFESNGSFWMFCTK